MKPPLLIVNPASGSRTAAKLLPRILAAVERTLGDVAIRHTACRGHAMELAFEGTLEGHPLIVAVGGDGTLSEVANGVLRAADAAAGATPEAAAKAPALSPAVGLISVGTGGDFRRSLGVGAGYERSLEALALGRERMVDVGRAEFTDLEGKETARYFVNVLSAGLGGLVDRYIAGMPQGIGGKAGYYLASLRAVLASREQPVLARIGWLGEKDIAPMALPDDGRLEIVTITERNRRSLISKMRLIYDGRHLGEPTVGHFPCERIELRIEDQAGQRGFLLDVDGEPLGSLPLSVEIQPRRLRIRA
jgi:diacylglycerol kinase family enzyme